MKKVFSSVAVGSLLLLVGAGCNQPAADTTTPPTDQTGGVTTPPVVENEPAPAPEQNNTAEIKLSGEALGKNMVKFTWELPAGMENPSSFRLVRGPKENPTSPGSYYFQLIGSKRETTWVSLPAGKQFFRICTFKDDKCDVFSNNVEVEVK